MILFLTTWCIETYRNTTSASIASTSVTRDQATVLMDHDDHHHDDVHDIASSSFICLRRLDLVYHRVNRWQIFPYSYSIGRRLLIVNSS